jgi:hypothetical protein
MALYVPGHTSFNTAAVLSWYGDVIQSTVKGVLLVIEILPLQAEKQVLVTGVIVYCGRTAARMFPVSES